MPVGIVFADMDGTFVTSTKEITADNWAMLDELARRSIPFVPCSGRSVSGLPAELLAHPAVHHVITTNGAVICERDESAQGGWRTLSRQAMAATTVRDLYERVCDRDITFDVFLDGQAYAESWRYRDLERFGLSAAGVALFRGTRIEVDKSVPELLEGYDMVEKITSFWHERADRDLITSLVDADPSIMWVSSGAENVEINNAKATKGFGLTWLCEYLGVPVHAALAFGDNLNDVSMLEAAGDGVAMANASEEALAAANHTTLDCDHSGVAAYVLDALARES